MFSESAETVPTEIVWERFGSMGWIPKTTSPLQSSQQEVVPVHSTREIQKRRIPSKIPGAKKAYVWSDAECLRCHMVGHHMVTDCPFPRSAEAIERRDKKQKFAFLVNYAEQ